MNSFELFRCAMELGVPERIPVAPMINVPHASHVLGVKPWEYVTDNELYVKGQLKAQEKYGYDWIFNHQPLQGVTGEERKNLEISEGYAILTTEFGVRVKLPLEEGPLVKEPALKDYSTVDELEMPDMEKKGRFEPLEGLLKATGETIYICSKVQAPFHYAAEWMRGMENFMLDMLTRPEDVKRLLEFMTDYAIEVGKRQIELGTHGIMMEDPSAASQVISPAHYEEFAYPYERKVCKALKKAGGEVIIHICGETTPILEMLADTGAACLSVDETVDLGEAIEKVGGKVALFGNVPVDILFEGKKEDVVEGVRQCISSAGRRGYILSSSCGLHAGTPPENVHAMVEAGKRYGGP